MSNLQFLTFFINTIRAVLKHESLLRASIASASNDLRLGPMKPHQRLFLFLLENNSHKFWKI